MSVRARSWAYSQRVGNPGRKLVLVTIADRCDPAGGCWMSIAEISQRSEVSERTAIEHLRALKARGFISITSSHRVDGGQDVNRYELNASWRTFG